MCRDANNQGMPSPQGAWLGLLAVSIIAIVLVIAGRAQFRAQSVRDSLGFSGTQLGIDMDRLGYFGSSLFWRDTHTPL